MKCIYSVLLITLSLAFVLARPVSAQQISLLHQSPTSVRVYEKYEVKFNLQTTSLFPFFQYDATPPPGVKATTGVTVEGIFKKSGKTWVQPAFYMTETNKIGSGARMYFTETGKKYWALRFSPQETGVYDVSIHVKDANQDVTQPIGSFTVTNPLKKGFVRVSKSDTRYFEFSNGELYFPIGPASTSDNNFAKLANTGENFVRLWMGGLGAYSSNWSRWKSSAARLGNEGFAAPISYDPGPTNELTYTIYYPAGYRIWLGTWQDPMFGPRIEKDKKYQYKIHFKASNIAGPRNAAFPYGFVIRSSDGLFGTSADDRDTFEAVMRNNDPKVTPYASPLTILAHVKDNKSGQWQTITGAFTTDTKKNVRNSIYLYLDNVTSGQVNIDEFSVREVLPDGSLGGEVVRNPRADLHTYVEQRPAAFLDWQIEQGEQYGVFFKYVVHDKNDWIQNHLKIDGSWTGNVLGSDGKMHPGGDGYFQPENTKARWLLRQWYRYIAARWGYSTAIHTWELLNEGPPVNSGPHATTAQAFASFMHKIDSHRHLTTTSHWCCWRSGFWGNASGAYPDIDYADIHEYTTNPLEEKNGVSYPYDMAMWNYDTGRIVSASKVGKPIMRAETGIAAYPAVSAITKLGAKNTPNPGVWYHNLLWSQLTPYALFDPGYWFGNHFANINKETISRPFYIFISGLDFSKGGYIDAVAVVSNTKLRVWGQKNLAKNKVYLWIQNSDHTWKNVLDNIRTKQSANVTIKLNPNVSYRLEWFNTCSEKESLGCNGQIIRTENKVANSQGNIAFQVTDLADDVALRIVTTNTPLPTTVIPSNIPTATSAQLPSATQIPPSPTAVPWGTGEVNGISPVNYSDIENLYQQWFSNSNLTPKQGPDQYGDGLVNSLDYAVVYGKLNP